MIDSKRKETLWAGFKEFIDPAADRFAVLEKILKKSGLEYHVLSIAGNSHFLITPLPEEKNRSQRQTLLVAHYDRAPDSPGANDNSAGVFMLIEAAMNLEPEKEKNWAIILTDKEELKSGEAIQNQGAYTLALNLREMNMGNSRIFSFDACGTGDTLIISNTAGYFFKSNSGGERLHAAIHELQETALKTAHDLGTVKYFLTATPFSDDAGFLRAGLAAQTITMLPSHECNSLAQAIRKNPLFVDALVNREQKESHELKQFPETWKYMNGPNDTYERLTPENFCSVIRFAEALCKM